MTTEPLYPSRLNRGISQAFFGSDTYSKEELIAEIGAAMLMRTVGIDTESSLKNSASYVQGWMQQIRKDERLIVSAAAKAVKYILGNVDENISVDNSI